MALFRRKAFGRAGEWFYCLRHHAVEEGPECPAKDRFGPYATRGEAEHAMDIARERNVQWRNDPRWTEKDPRWADGDDRDGSPPGPLT